MRKRKFIFFVKEASHSFLLKVKIKAVFAAHKIVSEYAERINAYMEKTQRYTKLKISRQRMVQPKIFFRSFLSARDGLN